MTMIGVLPVISLAGRKMCARSGCALGFDRSAQPDGQTASAITTAAVIRLNIKFILQS
jgi:hypothetical protein